MFILPINIFIPTNSYPLLPYRTNLFFHISAVRFDFMAHLVMQIIHLLLSRKTILNISLLFLFLFCFYAMYGDSPGLLLVLYSGITL